MILNKDYTKISSTKLTESKQKILVEKPKKEPAKQEERQNVLFKVEFKVSNEKSIYFDVVSNADIHAELFEFFEKHELDTLMVLPFYCHINQTVSEMMLNTREPEKSLTLKRFSSMENKFWDIDAM